MSIIQRLRGTSDTKTTADFATDILGTFENDPIAAEAVGLAEQKTDGADVSVDDVVAQMRDESDAFDADFRAEVLVDLFGLVDEYANADSSTRNELAGELVGFLNDAQAYDLLTENGFENAKSAAESGDVERLQDIVSSDPDLQAAVQSESVLERLKEKVEWDVDALLTDDKADVDTNMTNDTDSKQEDGDGEGDGKMNPLDLVEQIGGSDQRDTVETYAESVGKDADEAAAEWVDENVDGVTVEGFGGGGGDAPEEPDMNADDYDDKDEDPDEEDKMSDTDGDSGTDAKSGDVVTSDELDSKLTDFKDDLLDSVADTMTDDETVAQIGQKLGESDEAREALADGIIDDVDEKLEDEGFVTPSPTQTADESSGKAADVLTGGDD